MTEDISQQVALIDSFTVGEPVFSTPDKVNQVVEYYQEGLTSQIRRLIGGDHHQAEDLVQTMFLRLLSNSFVFEGRDQLGAYLCKTATGVAKDYLRNQQTKNARNTRSIHHADGVEVVADPVAREQDRNEMEEQLARFEACIQDLSEQDKQLLRWKFLDGLTDPEIAALLGCSVGTVSSRFSRVKTMLRRG